MSNYRRLSSESAPSWTWASVHSYIRFPGDAFDKSDMENAAQVLSISCPTVDGDEYGRVRDAKLEISAYVRNERVIRVDKKKARLNLESSSKFRSDRCYYHLDTSADWDNLEEQEISLALIQSDHMLVLRRNEDGTFRRIGLCMPRERGKNATTVKGSRTYLVVV